MNGKDTKEFTEGLVFCSQGPVFSDQVPFDCMEMSCMALLKKNWWKYAKHVWRLDLSSSSSFSFPPSSSSFSCNSSSSALFYLTFIYCLLCTELCTHGLTHLNLTMTSRSGFSYNYYPQLKWQKLRLKKV